MNSLLSSTVQAIIGLAMVVAAALMGSGCSALPVSTQTPVVNVTCSWNAAEGAALEDNDCLIDRATSGGEQESTGNRIVAPVDANVDANVGLQ